MYTPGTDYSIINIHTLKKLVQIQKLCPSHLTPQTGNTTLYSSAYIHIHHYCSAFGLLFVE